MLPAVFETDDYLSCVDEHNLYCKVDARLNKPVVESELWTLIERTKSSPELYDRSVIHRAICVPAQHSHHLETYSKMAIDQSLRHLNLTSSVDGVICTSGRYETTAYDKIVLTALTAYTFLVVCVTVYDWWTRRGKTTRQFNRTKIVSTFSLLSSWEKIKNPKANADYNNLRAIQGIRSYTMLLELFMHTEMSLAQMYIANTEEVERIGALPIFMFLNRFGMFLVQPFFLISSLLLTVQVYDIFKKNGQFSPRDVAVLLLHRYFRIGVTLAVMVAVHKLSYWQAFNSPMTFDAITYNKNACEHHWLATLVSVNNIFFYMKDVCVLSSWHFSVDFQLYVATIVTLFFILRYRLDARKVLGALFIISCVFYGFVIYINDLSVIFQSNVNTAKRQWMFSTFPLKMLYYSTYSNWATSYVGAALGIYYSENKGRPIVKNNKVVSLLWALLFFGLPLSVVVLTHYEFSGLTAAVLGAIVKPLYSFGIGVGIIGMSRNVGGVVKKVCEWKYMELLSNLVFSVILCNFLVVYLNGRSSQALFHLDVKTIIESYIFDLLVSLCAGVVIALAIEQPGLSLQKMLLPQLRAGESKGSQKNK